VNAMPNVDVRIVPNVPLIHVGRWDASTGPWEVTADSLRSIVAAHCAAVVRPILKLGHETRLGDAAPALGYVSALRIINGGNTLLGDFAGVPRAIASLLPHAYPQRSVECLIDYTDTAGRTWPLVLAGVALLGGVHPAVKELTSLDDVAKMYGIDLAASARRVVTATAIAPDSTRARAVQVARARRTRINRSTMGEQPCLSS